MGKTPTKTQKEKTHTHTHNSFSFYWCKVNIFEELQLWRRPILAKVMYAKKACELVKEFSSSESGQLSAFNSDVFAQVIEECNTHFSQLQSLLRYNRAEVIRSLGWIKEAPLPELIQEKLGSSEKDYSQNHSATIRSYQLEMDIDLAVDMVPPKDPYIKVRVLEDIGSVALSDQIANLARHAILFLRRTDAETYISQIEASICFSYSIQQRFPKYLEPIKVNHGLANVIDIERSKVAKSVENQAEVLWNDGDLP
ncbi:hypothetical protein RHSIM_Rhsim03G0101400 [Rhododendron simsii]|uniref:DNA replication complex GINS protein PSF1 C-terminal domain-containing protein n=1 Tax=Rhododendron simsii TaxID=118357 RepID=A0A834LUU2_RHOSS|nr:hypothetical protein RHSIM_Rhsim03G0101400 [Rhododendron simsii]